MDCWHLVDQRRLQCKTIWRTPNIGWLHKAAIQGWERISIVEFTQKHQGREIEPDLQTELERSPVIRFDNYYDEKRPLDEYEKALEWLKWIPDDVSPWSGWENIVEWREIKEELVTLLEKKGYLGDAGSYTCGPTASMELLLLVSPVRFAQACYAIYTSGSLRGRGPHKVKGAIKRKVDKEFRDYDVDSLEILMIKGLRASGSSWRSYDGSNENVWDKRREKREEEFEEKLEEKDASEKVVDKRTDKFEDKEDENEKIRKKLGLSDFQTGTTFPYELKKWCQKLTGWNGRNHKIGRKTDKMQDFIRKWNVRFNPETRKAILLTAKGTSMHYVVLDSRFEISENGKVSFFVITYGQRKEKNFSSVKDLAEWTRNAIEFRK